MDFALNNLQRLICHKTPTTNQQPKIKKPYCPDILLILKMPITKDNFLSQASHRSEY